MRFSDLMRIQDRICTKCANRKPRTPGDCSIYRAVFIDKSPIATENIDKLFNKNSCKAFTPKQDMV